MSQNDLAMPDASAPPVDMDWLRECADCDVETMKAMVTLYFSQTEKLLAEMDVAIHAHSSADVRRIAHACSGSSGACGIVGMAQLMRLLEKMAADGQLENTATIVAAVKVEVVRAKTFLRAQQLV